MKQFVLFQRMRKITQYAIPICTTNLLAMSIFFFVTMMLSHLGKNELAAFAIANTCNITLTAFLNSCLYSTSILIGQHNAGEDKQEVASLIWNSIWLALLLGLVGMVLMWDMDKFLLFIGEPHELVDYTVTYFHYSAYGMVPLLLGAALAQMYNGLGKPLVSTTILGIRLPITLYFCYELILGHYHLGLAGAALGLLIAQIFMLIISMIYMRFSFIWSYFQMKVNILDWKKIAQIFNMGVHVGLQFLGELAAISGATFLLGYLGSVALASSQIVSQYFMFLIMIVLGVSQALSIRVSEAVGRKEYKIIDSYTWAAFWILFIILLLFIIVYSLIPSELMSLFININDPNNAPLVHLTYWFLLIAIPTIFFDSVKNVLTGTLRGLKNVKAPMIIGNVSLWLISLPLCYVIGIFFKGGPIGLRIGFSIGYAVAAIILCCYYQRFTRIVNI
jgi:MATE family multidrug resistance protein